ncbi:MAG: LysR family transcriptional regulator [Hyphomicrobiales bacterium]|nr:LysR family transcriptional regulator [Hyphomicrobiales bacterium]
MDIFSLRYALQVSQYLSFRGAAKYIGIGQAALSRRVRALEDEIGVSIFERHPSGVKVTLAGREFLSRVRSVLDELEHAVERANMAGQAETGILRIGFFHSLAAGKLRDVLLDYRAQWPSVILEFLEADNETQVVALRERRLDVGFIVGFDSVVGLDHEMAWTEQAFVAIPEQHPLARRNEIALNDLKDENFVMRARFDGSGALGWVVRSSDTLEPASRVTTHTVSRETLIALVGAGFGLTILAQSATAIAVPGVAFRPIKEPAVTIPFRMIWSAENDNPALRRFLSHVRLHTATTKSNGDTDNGAK